MQVSPEAGSYSTLPPPPHVGPAPATPVLTTLAVPWPPPPGPCCWHLPGKPYVTVRPQAEPEEETQGPQVGSVLAAQAPPGAAGSWASALAEEADAPAGTRRGAGRPVGPAPCPGHGVQTKG